MTAPAAQAVVTEKTVRWFTSQEVAALVRKSDRTIRRWCATQSLPAKQWGRGYRIAEDVVRALLDGAYPQLTEPASPAA